MRGHATNGPRSGGGCTGHKGGERMTATLRTTVEPVDVLYDAELKADVSAWCHRHGIDPNKVTRLDAVSEHTVEVEQHVTAGPHGTQRLLNAARTDVLRFRYTVHTSETPPWVRR